SGICPVQRLRYKIILGVKNRNAEFTKEFGGQAHPELISLCNIKTCLNISIKLLYLIQSTQVVCLDALTSKALGYTSIDHLMNGLNKLIDNRFIMCLNSLRVTEYYRTAHCCITTRGARYLELFI